MPASTSPLFDPRTIIVMGWPRCKALAWQACWTRQACKSPT